MCFFWIEKDMVICVDYSHLMKKNVHMVIFTWKTLYFQHVYNMWFFIFCKKKMKTTWSVVGKFILRSVWNMGKIMRIKIHMGILYWKKKPCFFSWKIDIFRNIIHKWWLCKICEILFLFKMTLSMGNLMCFFVLFNVLLPI